jgi:aspartyl-tRNA(Asn)/glutamyl-tRNA(Gln) amidotransferase subunit B
MLWDEQTEEPRPMRRKEGSDDYRYFPEPDLMELEMAPAYIDEIRRQMPELPRERRSRYREQFSLHEEAVSLLGSNRALGDYFENLIRAGVDPRTAASWVQGEVQRVLLDREISIEEFPLEPFQLAELVSAVVKGAISNSQAKDVFRKMVSDGRSAAQIIAAEGMVLMSDAGELRKVIANILTVYPEDVQRYRAGKRNLMGFFMGEAMKATGGRADPKMLSSLLQDILNGE